MRSFFHLVQSLFLVGRGLFTFFILMVIAFAIQRSSDQEKMHLVECTLTYVLFPAQYIANTLTHWDFVENENRTLRHENTVLRLEIDELRQQLASESRREEHDIQKQQWGDLLIEASVVAKNPGRLQTSLLIDQGANQGIQPGMPVLTPRGLVGKIAKAYLTHSIVQLLFDPQCRVSVLENRTRLTGILESPDSKDLHVDMPAHTLFQKGDTLFTSGLGGIYPKGVMVGTVQLISDGDLGVMQRLHIQPNQKPSKIEEVMVLRLETDWVVKEFAK